MTKVPTTVENPRTDAVVVGDNCLVQITTEDQQVLKECLGVRGFISQCWKRTDVSRITQHKYTEENATGEKAKVDAVMAFAKQFHANLQQAS